MGIGAAFDATGRVGPTFVGTVYPFQLDHMGHVNIQFYVGLFDQASWGFFTWMGLGADRIAAEQVGMAALVQENRFLSELHPGVSLEAWTRVLATSDKTVRYQHDLHRRGAGNPLVATSVLTAACLDLTRRRARPLPDDIRQRLDEAVQRGAGGK
ncbi:MAG: thioesterase family protein [Thermaerobacter sp.]|nr:thioesterase family protein [Thermaerobacter sp.]